MTSFLDNDKTGKSLGFLPTKNYSCDSVSSPQHPESIGRDKIVVLMNRLQKVVMTLGQEAFFKFPQIVVVGDQSSGKTSVLESLVGKSFLPRGLGTVTRRPLLIRLETLTKNDNAERTTSKDKVIFGHTVDVFDDFNLVMKEIEEDTEKYAGNNKGICANPITMTIYSTQAALNLTLVDLPGLVKVPIGDQPQDVEIMVRELILKYISNPNAIIMAVITANTDIATNESLKIAREVDPNGERTIVVVTKLDLMDTGTNAFDLLSGNVISENLGIVGVINRSQRDVIQGKSLRASALEEMNYLYKNYPSIAHKNGRIFLVKCLQNALTCHIQKYLPNLAAKIDSALHIHNKQLKALLGPIFRSPNESLLQILTSFVNSYISQVRGQHTEIDTQELKGGARISFVFQEVFSAALKNIRALEGHSRSTIFTALRNSAGAKPCIFVPESCFELLLKKEIVRLEGPALCCVQLVYDEMEKMLYGSSRNPTLGLHRYPKLSQKIIDISLKLLKSRIGETNKLVENIIAIHGAYINTAHPDFASSKYCCKENESGLIPISEEGDEIPLVPIIEKLIIKYFNIVKIEVLDVVPKAIMHCFVNYVLEHINYELVSNLYSTGVQNQELMEQSVTIVEQKKNILRIIEELEKGKTIISELKDGILIE